MRIGWFSISGSGEAQRQPGQSQRGLERIAHHPRRVRHQHARAGKGRHRGRWIPRAESRQGTPRQKQSKHQRHHIERHQPAWPRQPVPGRRQQRVGDRLGIGGLLPELLQYEGFSAFLGRCLDALEIRGTKHQISVQSQAFGHGQKGALVAADHRSRASHREQGELTQKRQGDEPRRQFQIAGLVRDCHHVRRSDSMVWAFPLASWRLA